MSTPYDRRIDPLELSIITDYRFIDGGCSAVRAPKRRDGDNHRRIAEQVKDVDANGSQVLNTNHRRH
jgi:hypothetical protein